MNGEAINRIVDLIRAGLPLDDDHCVTYNQMIPIPSDQGMFCAVGILDSKPYSGSLSYAPGVAVGADGVSETPLLLERQSVNVREVFSIHLMSRNNSARLGRWRLLFALSNTAAQQSQETYGWLLGRLPISFLDASTGEGAERLNRFTLTIVALSAQAQEGPVAYFDKPAPGTPLLVVNQ